MKVRIRLDRPAFQIVPAIGDRITVGVPENLEGKWKVVDREYVNVGVDAVNEKLYVGFVELELERYP